MPTVLITGINGFTGRYMAREFFSEGYTVVGLDDNATDGVICCNLLDRIGLLEILIQTKPDVVVHLAGIAFVGHGDADEIYRTNVVGTRNLLESIVKSGSKPKSVLLASSANVYGNAIESIDETTVASPMNDYAVSKLSMEYMARLWFDQLPITLVRPFNYTGVGQSLSFLLPKIVDHFRRLAPVIELGNLDVIRDFSDVRSVVKCYRRLVESGVSGEVFNICSGQGYSLLEVIQMMREITSHNIEILVNPNFVRVGEVHRQVGSRVKLVSAIGVVSNVSLMDTLKWMLESDGGND